MCPVGHQSTAADYCDECGRTMPQHEEALQAATNTLIQEVSTGVSTAADPGDLICRFCATPITVDDQFCEGCGHENPLAGPGGGATGNEGTGGNGAGVGGTGAGGAGASGAGAGSRGTGGTGTGGTGSTAAKGSGGTGDRGAANGTHTGTVTRTLWTVRIGPDHDYFLRVLQWDGPDAPAMRFPHEEDPWTLELTGESMRIGRRNSSTTSAPPEIALADPGVSRRHAMLLRCGDGTWEVMDLDSANGTTINSGYERVRRDPVRLRDGDRVHVGAWTTLEIRCVEL
jgi:hypothetical protein